MRSPTTPVPASSETRGCVELDGHVHLHPRHDAARLFRRGLERARGSGCPLVLFLTESAAVRAFAALANRADGAASRATALRVERTGETTSLRIVAAETGPALYLVSGRQVVSSERLEVLIVGLAPDDILHDLPDLGVPAEELVRRGLDAGAVTILPWGFGKWLGARGAVVRRLCEAPGLGDRPLFFVGDIPSRCRPWGTPAVFRKARILRGTDILPLAGHEDGLARYGSRVRAAVDPAQPCRSLLDAFRQGAPIEPFGVRDGLLRTVIGQIGYRLRGRPVVTRAAGVV